MRFDMNIRKLLTGAVCAAAFAFSLLPAAHAGGSDYGAPQRTINAGIIGDAGALPAGHIAWPYVFYLLSQREDGTPTGWRFVNPLAERNLTPTAWARWGDPNSSDIGRALTPDWGPYWEVLLNGQVEAALQQYQVLLLEETNAQYQNNVPQNYPVSAQASEVLRQYVSGGGILWIDIDGPIPTPSNALSTDPPFTDFDPWWEFLSSTTSPSNSVDRGSPILSPGLAALAYPFDLLTTSGIEYLPGSEGPLGLPSGDLDGFFSEAGSTTGSSASGYQIAVGHLGAGLVVVTSTGVAREVCVTNGSTANVNGPLPNIYTQWQPDPNPNDVQPPPIAPAPADISDLQLVANIIAQSNMSQSPLRTYQLASGSGDLYGTAVLPSWRYLAQQNTGGGGNPPSTFPPATVYGQYAYLVDPNTEGTTPPSTYRLSLAPAGNQASNPTLIAGLIPTTGSGGSTPSGFSGPAIVPENDGNADIFYQDSNGQPYYIATSNTAPGSTAAPAPMGDTLSGISPFTGVVPSPDVFGTMVATAVPQNSGGITTYLCDLDPYSVKSLDPAGGGTAAGAYYRSDPMSSAGSVLSEFATGSPAIGVIHDDCDNIVEAIPSNHGLATVFLGARGEQLIDAGYQSGQSQAARAYQTKLNQIGSFAGKVDPTEAAAHPYDSVYTIDPNTGLKDFLPATVDSQPGGTQQRFLLTAGLTSDPGAAPVFADYNVDVEGSQFQNGSTTAIYGALNRAFVGNGDHATASNNSTAGTVSTPVIARNGDIYFTATCDPSGGSATGTPPTNVTPDSAIEVLRDTYHSGDASNTKLLWRFRIPAAADGAFVDGNGNTYGPITSTASGTSVILPGITNMTFVGQPVVDANNNVYVAAQGVPINPATGLAVFPQGAPPTQGDSAIAILAFNGNSQPSIVYPPGSSASQTTGLASVGQPSLSITQPLLPTYNAYVANPGQANEFNEFGLNIQTDAGQETVVQANQYTVDNNSVIFNSFADFAAGGVPNSIFPNLSEPEPVAVMNNTNNANQSSQAGQICPMIPNLMWFVVIPSPAMACADPGLIPMTSAQGGACPPISSLITPPTSISGLQIAGGYLFFNGATASGGNHLYRLSTNLGQASSGSLEASVTGSSATTTPGGIVTTAWIPGTDSNNRAYLEDLGDTGVGAVGAPPTVSGGAVLVSGQTGVSAFVDRETLVSAQDRIIGFDGDGNAAFTIDGTEEPAPSTVDLPEPTQVSHEAFNRPTAISQDSTGRYLVADSGNNRCVEVDRGGNVFWELARFKDPNQLLRPTDPVTLKNPTSVQKYLGTYTQIINNQPTTGPAYHYLIADTGNYRIIDVADPIVKGVIQPLHLLYWVTTSQELGRKYKYTSAIRYVQSTTKNQNATPPTVTDNYEIIAIVDKHVSLISGAPGPASAESDTGSIVMMDAGIPGSSPTSGQIINFIDHIYTSSSATASPIGVLHPHYLGSYTPDPGQMTQLYKNSPQPYDGHDELLLCDDNGAFDLDPSWTSTQIGILPSTATTHCAGMLWAMSRDGTLAGQSGSVASAYNAITTPIDIAHVNYSRTAIPFMPNCLQRTGTDFESGTYYGRYLISTGYSQGQVAGEFGTSGVPGFGGEVFLYSAIPGSAGGVLTPRTFSRPANTGPTSQPSYAVLAK